MSDTQSETKTCPYCAETIKAAAIKCRYCQSDLGALEAAIALMELHAPRVMYRKVNDTNGQVSLLLGCTAEGCGYTTNVHRKPSDVDEVIDGRFANHRLDISQGDSQMDSGSPFSPSSLAAKRVERKPWPHRASAIPLTQWRGMGKMTRQASVAAYCNDCGTDWSLDAAVSNTIAQEQGLAGKLQRRGTAMEQFGATFSIGASGRRIAAGNERERQEEQLIDLHRLAACPGCGSTDVLLAKM